jgi:hypothetical protein
MSVDTSEQVDGQQPAAAPTTPETPRQRSKRQAEWFQQACSLLDDASLFLQDLQEEKQEEFNERSERWRESEKGEAAEEQIRLLEEAIEYIGQAQFLLDGYGG